MKIIVRRGTAYEVRESREVSSDGALLGLDESQQRRVTAEAVRLQDRVLEKVEAFADSLRAAATDSPADPDGLD